MKLFKHLAILTCLFSVLTFAAQGEAAPFNGDCTLTWDANKESDLAGYRAWFTKGATQGTIVNIPVSATPSVKCSQLGITTDGLYVFSVVAYDTAGTANASTAATISETRDSVPPDTSLTPTITGANATFTLTSTETGSVFECKLDDSAFVQCTTPRTYTALDDGEHTFTARAKDPAGNLDATPPAHVWTVNVKPPTQPTGLKVTPHP